MVHIIYELFGKHIMAQSDVDLFYNSILKHQLFICQKCELSNNVGEQGRKSRSETLSDFQCISMLSIL